MRYSCENNVVVLNFIQFYTIVINFECNHIEAKRLHFSHETVIKQ